MKKEPSRVGNAMTDLRIKQQAQTPAPEEGQANALDQS
jgi:hypothetical protein